MTTCCSCVGARTSSATVLARHPSRPQTLCSRYPGEFLGLLASDQLAFFRRMAREGDGVQVRMGRERMVLLSHPEDIKSLLVVEQRSFSKGRALDRLKVMLGRGLLTNEGESHLRQRRLVQPAFHRERVAGYGMIMAEYAERVACRWRPGATLDIHDEMMRLTRDITYKTLFDLEVDEDPGGIEETIALSLKMFRVAVLPMGTWAECLPIPFVRRLHQARARLNAWLLEMIRRRRDDRRDRGDLLSMLLQAQDTEAASAGMSNVEVRDEMLTLFVAGHETTALALTWTWYLLSRHPEIEAKLYAELTSVLSGRRPTAADAARLPYTRMVFAEALRLYPPAWLIERRATRTVQLRDRLIAAGSLVYASPYIVHHDPRWYSDPERFNPERWRPEATVERSKFAYFPFGGGSRMCIGEQFAWMEGVLVLATIAQRRRLVHDPTHVVAREALVTLRPKHGMRMHVELPL